MAKMEGKLALALTVGWSVGWSDGWMRLNYAVALKAQSMVKPLIDLIRGTKAAGCCRNSSAYLSVFDLLSRFLCLDSHFSSIQVVSS